MSRPPRHPPALPELMDEPFGEILLRIPLDEPADLARATLVSKSWLRVLSDPTFRRGYRKRHCRPPLPGFIHNIYNKGPIPRFIFTTASPCSQPALSCSYWWAAGRSTLATAGCSSTGSDHLDCAGGPFRVVFVGTDDSGCVTWASVYSSETRDWSTMATADSDSSTAVNLRSYIEMKPGILIDDTLYFTLEAGLGVLKYDLVRHGLSVIDAPEPCDHMGTVMVAEDGGLGYAAVEHRKLNLWSWLTGEGSSARWMLRRVIQLQSLLPIHNPSISHEVIGFAEGTDTIFLLTDDAVFTLEIKLGKTKKVGRRGAYYVVLPFMSFCAPGAKP
ncbi:unnamed protein product [Urochloa decumbens]|uniref:F-box protein AT5G49610-like beta-propeller domain-containing protein n=1 Tax=Urochloa decumbens TaxID=240449 RepID=A0ABC9G9V9_9POAL